MIKLEQALAARSKSEFKAVFQSEVEALPAEQLPLQQGLSLSSYVSGEPFRVMVISTEDKADALEVKAGIFYSGIIAGCSCSDDPTPTDVQPEYCEVQFEINKETAETSLVLLNS